MGLKGEIIELIEKKKKQKSGKTLFCLEISKLLEIFVHQSYFF